MIPTYRLIHFSPVPHLGARFPIAAVVSHGGGVEVVRMPHLPGERCLGGARKVSVLRLVLDSLESVSAFERLPSSAGPHAVLDDVKNLPAGIGNPVKWVEQHLLSAGGAPTGKRASVGHRSRRRATYGWSFLEKWDVDPYVKKDYRPDRDWDRWLARSAAALPRLTHWVEGADESLFMEPIRPTRAQALGDVKKVATDFGAYKWVIGNAPELRDKRASMIAYVLPGGKPRSRLEMIESLAVTSDRVFDTESGDQRDALFSEIRRVHAEGEGRLYM